MSRFGTLGLPIAILSLVAVACSSSSSEPDGAGTDAGADVTDAAGEAKAPDAGRPGCRQAGEPCDDDLMACCSLSCYVTVSGSACR
jgi:hypothetical protein